MTNSTTFANGSIVDFKGIECEVIEYAKGWYTLKEVAGDGTAKARAKDLKPAGGKSRNMSETLRRYAPGYEGCKAYSGRNSLKNGDDVANFLDGMSPADVLTKAEQILGYDKGELIARYENLNPGQQRMNGGNLLRFAIKRGDITPKDLH